MTKTRIPYFAGALAAITSCVAAQPVTYIFGGTVTIDNANLLGGATDVELRVTGDLSTPNFAPGNPSNSGFGGFSLSLFLDGEFASSSDVDILTALLPANLGGGVRFTVLTLDALFLPNGSTVSLEATLFGAGAFPGFDGLSLITPDSGIDIGDFESGSFNFQDSFSPGLPSFGAVDSFSVIPAPGAALVLMAAGGVAATRRRRACLSGS